VADIIDIAVGEDPLIVKVGKEEYKFLPPSQVDGKKLMGQFRSRVLATKELDSLGDEDEDAPMGEEDINRMEAGLTADIDFLAGLAISEAEGDRFREAPLPLAAASQIMQALMERYTGRPTERSPSSSGRPSAPRKGGRR
jgi:hypothetical protein